MGIRFRYMLVSAIALTLSTAVGWATTKDGSPYTGSDSLSNCTIGYMSPPPEYIIVSNGHTYVVSVANDIPNDEYHADTDRGLALCVTQNDSDNSVNFDHGMLVKVCTMPMPQKKK